MKPFPSWSSGDPLVNAAMDWLFTDEMERHYQAEVQEAIKRHANAQKAESKAADRLGKLTKGRKAEIKLPDRRGTVRVWHAEGHAIVELVRRKRKP